MTRVLYLLFFASGATGLVYQVLWLRLTGLVFGNTSHSIAIVLGAFMAGLALGNWRIGMLADRTARPLRLYGWLEILIGISALLVPVLFAAMDSIYWGFAAQLDAVPGLGFTTRFVASFAIMVVPTLLMGGTLPAMARLFVHNIGQVEGKLATLYALNTFGAAVGVLAAAIVLVPRLGSQATTALIAALNILIGLAAIGLDRRLERASEVAATDSNEVSGTAREAQSAKLVLLTVFVSGFVALLYEVAWTRALTALISNSTYAFAIMLVTFLVGIAFGSSWAARFRPVANLRLLGAFQFAIAAGGLVFLVGYLLAPGLLVKLIHAFDYAFPAVLTVQFIICAALMILATFFMGATLPIAAQLYSTSMRVLGTRIGSVYSINTLGAIAGSLGAGFILLPLLGTERTILLGTLCNAAIAIALFSKSGERVPVLGRATLLVLLVGMIAISGGRIWSPGDLDRGVLIYAQQFAARPNLRIDEHYAETDVVFFREGKNASVSVRQGSGYVGLRVNGKVDASNGNDKKTQLLLGYLPGFHHPAPTEVLVIGYGSGVTSGVATVFPTTERVDTVEIEPAVVEAGRFFADYNRRSWEHPKVRLIEDDARNLLNVTDTSYDIIISEPSNPWIAGIGNLFTAEFYALAANALSADGIFAQWLPLYELSPANVRMVLAEIARQFPETSVWHMDTGDIIVLASRRPLRLQTDVIDKLWNADASVRRDYHEFLETDSPFGLLANYVTGTDGVLAFAGDAPRNTDNRPLLEYSAPRNLYARTLELNVGLLNEHKTSPLPDGLSARARERALLAIIDPLLRRDRFEAASRAVTELATAQRSSDESLYLAMAAATIHTGQFGDADDALAKAEQAAGEADQYAAYRSELRARLAAARGNGSAAIAHYRRAVGLAPNRGDYLFEIARLYAAGQSWPEAARWLDAYIETGPYPPAAYRALLGEYLFAVGRTTEATDAFEAALELDSYSVQARLGLAAASVQQGDNESAIELLSSLIPHAVDRSPAIYAQLAALYIEEGRHEAARCVLEKGARIFPTNTAITERLQQLPL